MRELPLRRLAAHAALAALLSAVMFVFLPVGAHAQTAGKRERKQQAHIARGVRTGQLSPRAARHIERRQAALNREEKSMRRRNGGTLTADDLAKLQRQQNQLSRSIYRDKHSGAAH